MHSVPLKIEVDLQLTLMASTLYRLLALRVGRGMENPEPSSENSSEIKPKSKSDPTTLWSRCPDAPTTPTSSLLAIWTPTIPFHGLATEDYESVNTVNTVPPYCHPGNH